MVKTDESLADRRKRARRILAALRRTYGPATSALRHESALHLLIATILSAQSTDENVNRVTPGLFKKYRSAEGFATADLKTLEKDVYATGFFRQKARAIQGSCRLIMERHGGEVPDTMEELAQLPGVARKTANVVLGTWFGRNEGIVVDTHVGRLAERMALTWRSKTSKDAVKIESDLMELLPRKDWTYLGHAMIRHGRMVCSARRPRCAECSVAKHCPSAGTFDDDSAGGGAATRRRSAGRAGRPR